MAADEPEAAILRRCRAAAPMTPMDRDTPLTPEDVNAIMGTLFDIRRDTTEILALLKDDDEEEEVDA